jgi:hypothetical protein
MHHNLLTVAGAAPDLLTRKSELTGFPFHLVEKNLAQAPEAVNNGVEL